MCGKCVQLMVALSTAAAMLAVAYQWQAAVAHAVVYVVSGE
jgi:hypothetical protein